VKRLLNRLDSVLPSLRRAESMDETATRH
jgi:hypothetical protein